SKVPMEPRLEGPAGLAPAALDLRPDAAAELVRAGVPDPGPLCLWVADAAARLRVGAGQTRRPAGERLQRADRGGGLRPVLLRRRRFVGRRVSLAGASRGRAGPTRS